MIPKMKKIHRYLKNMLVMVLVVALVGSNLLTSSMTAYAKEVTTENTETNEAEEASAQDETAAEDTTTDTSSTETTATEGTASEATDESVTETTTTEPVADTDETSSTETNTTETAENESETTDSADEAEKSLTVDAQKSGEKVLAAQKTYNLGNGKDISKETLFDDAVGYGFSDAAYPNEAQGWISGVYYPREASVTTGAASYVENGDGYAAISSKVWTETESTGYGIYTYENTSTLDFNLDSANYDVTVTLVNPTSSEISAYVEAEDITKESAITVAAGETKNVEFTACLVDGVLNLKFLGTSSATTEATASTKTVYVKSVSFEKVENEAGSKPTIFIASDSTVQTYEASYYPQSGWGQELYKFFGELVDERECDDCDYSQSQTYETENVIIENRAIGGRSSKSFIEEGKLDDLLEDVKPGDYLLVQWGHNDATSSRPNRYVSSADFEKWMQYYVDGATQRGATCVLVTPVARYSYTTTESGELDSFASNFEAYRQVMKKIADEQDVPLVDLTQLSIDLCNNFGIEGAKSLFLMLAAGEYSGYYAGGVSDSTHLQQYGAYKFAQCVAKGIEDNDKLAELASTVKLTLPENVPATPANLATTTIGASSISMTWDAASDAELYYIFRQELTEGQTADDVDFSSATKYSVSSKNSYTDSACAGGKTYVYAVAGFNELGLGTLSDKITVTTKSSAYKFDFGLSTSSNVMEGWTEITEKTMYSASVGYGFITAPGAARNRANNGNADSSALADDFCLGASEFALDLPNGDYEVTIYACDLLPGTSTIKASYTGEGKSIGTISTKLALASMTATVRVADGQLNIGIGGTNAYINGMEVTPILGTPTQLTYNENELEIGDFQSTFLISFMGIDEAAYYNVYQKATATDKKFSVIKKIQAADINNLDALAMTAVSGETYQYYVTAVTAGGAESGPSNTIEIKMIDLSVPVPVAPQNVKCDNAQNGSITLSWDNAGDASSYVIYRSSKAEGEKGFKEFTKVGTSTTASFTDTGSDLTTNIHYYYKVQGKNKGGVGELSAACQTPITGELVASAPEKLTDRGIVAVNLAGDAGADTSLSATDSEGNEYTSGVYVSWRAFEADFDGDNNVTTTFTVYRNDTPIASDIKVTNLVDEGGKVGDVYKVVGSNDGSLGLQPKETKAWDNQYLELQLYKPADETMPDATTCTYTANDMSVGDVDGDGDYELFVKWYPSNAQDNSVAGYTGKTFIDAYDIDMSTGAVKLLYRIDFGVNIRSGAHYTQFQVWDYDGDGKAELAAKTADGTTIYQSTDGTDTGLVETGYVGACNTDALPTNTISSANDYRNSSGYILNGSEYLTMFDDDGTILDTTDYLPARGTVSAWGDSHGNRVDRFLSATAYLDGETPSAIFSRGYYTRMTVTAYNLLDTDNDNIGDKLATTWEFDTNNLLEEYTQEEIEAQGFHNLSINDVDNDGKDEIIYGSVTIDHDGSLMYTTGLGHGDAMHVSDWVKWNDGLEIMQVHEHDNAAYHVEIHDAETGEILMGYYTGKDTGRGVAADIDPTYPQAEFWSIASPSYVSSDEPAWNSKTGGVYSSSSTLEKLITISNSSPASNAAIFWDGDLLSEIFDHTFDTTAYVPLTTTISDWDYETGKEVINFESSEVFTSNGTKGNPGLIADILGDWREEMILRSAADNSKIRVYTTTIQTDYVVPCLLENLAYREGVAWQNVGYNQVQSLSYLLSDSVITAQVSVAETTKNSVTINFTPANDGTYGHEIQGYEVYRTVTGSEDYSLVATIQNNDLIVKDGTSGENTVYVYKDTTAKGGTGYVYKVAAIIDNKTSFMSRTSSANTLVDVKEVKALTLADIVEDTALAEGQTVASLLPTTVTVVDSNDNEVQADVAWDVSEVDLSTPGTYKVYATVSGYDEVVEVTLKVIENAITAYTAISDIKTVIGNTVTLPSTVEVTYLNGTKKLVNVVKWNGTYDNNKLGTYKMTAEVEDESNVEISVNVVIVNDYVTAVTGTFEPIEILINDEMTTSDLPSTIAVKYASGNTGTEEIDWNLIAVDTSKAGVITIKGSVDDVAVSQIARVVAYPALYKFDFGIDKTMVQDGWTGVTTNIKGGTKSVVELGIEYTKEKGYGFVEAASFQGRTETSYTHQDDNYPMPTKVYHDFALLSGQEFKVDLPNGDYVVEIMCNSELKSNAQGLIEGVAYNFSAAAGKYAVQSFNVSVKDKQMNITFTNSNSRIGAVVIRTVKTKFDVTFDTDSGSAVATQTVEKDGLVTEPTVPTKEGYTFEGWYKDAEFTTVWNFAADKVTADTVLYANWIEASTTPTDPEKEKFTVSFHTNGGSAVADQTIEKDGLVTKPEIPTREGYTFEDWYKDSEFVTAWDFGADKITADTVLYANWTKDVVVENYTVAFNSNGGSATASQTIESGKLVTEPKAPTRTGYTFGGWYKENSFLTKWNFKSDKVTGATILYAKWNAIKVSKIAISGNDSIIGIGTTNTLTATAEPTNAAVKTVLWSSSDSKIATVSTSGVVTGKKNGTVTITATAADGSGVAASVKITVGYKITYKLNGGKNNAKNLSGFEGNKAVKLQTPTRSGYTFKGWYTDSKFKTKITQIKKGTKKAVTVYAKWEKITVDKASIKSVTNSGKSAMKVTTNAVSKAKGYEIVYSTDSKFKNNVTTVLAKKSATIKNLTKGSTYYVKVRAYKVDPSGNKVYGKYSSVKKVQIKK
ncbi:rhamnogalacturonan lyase family protein [Konateibacter massiliensis]|uniref:rhamnogalacturonan lyase family protein n=1 Tax=Konateibacter massiliensis TaxID=2002841 RepID=UPI000C157210|nr:InlB B-repeat-containing protein [Konateibacter massiliensis]